MQAVVGGNVRYPNLQSIADLFRSGINDTFNSAGGLGTGSGGGAGLIMPNANPDLLTFMDSAIQELFSDLSNIGDPELILDNYILTGIPPLAQADPAVQVSLAYSGYFNGFTWSNQWALPIGVSRVLALWERTTNQNESFSLMTHSPFGLPGTQQGRRMVYWETREGQIWMPGSLSQTDIRIRARMAYPVPLYSSNLDFTTAYVPILDSRNVIVAKMLILYAKRFAPEMYSMAIQEEARLLEKIRMEVVRQMQAAENQRVPFGDEAVQDFNIAFSWL